MNKKEKEFCKQKKINSGYASEIPVEMIKRPITIFLGPNGTGKLTSLALMKEKFNREYIKYIEYSTTKDDIVVKSSNPFAFDVNGLISAFHSEGERMDDSFYLWKTKTMLKAILEDKQRLYLLIDELDSGTSIDKLYQQLIDLCFIILSEHKRGREIFLIMTANSYEFIDILNDIITELEFDWNQHIDMIWVPSKQYIKRMTYKIFKKKYMEYLKEVQKKN